MIWQLLTRRSRRQALQQLVAELYTYNKKDVCWDPIGPIDRDGMTRVIEVIARGKLPKPLQRQAIKAFAFRKKLTS